MSMRSPSMRPAWFAWFVVGGSTALGVALAVASSMGLIGSEGARRCLGLVFGLMIVMLGNVLPKLRPFNWLGVDASSAAVERFAAWLLVAVGVAWLVLFALAPVQRAQPAAALVGIGAVAIIAASWIWLAGKALLSYRQREGAFVLSGYAAAKWQLTGWLLFAFFYAFLTACIKFLVTQRQFANELSLWVLAGFWLLYAALYAVFGRARGR